MELYIRIIDGAPFEHPIFGDNFREAFPEVDTDNLPTHFAKFVRVPEPDYGVYEVYEGCTYQWDGDVVTDVHHIRAMTEEEKIAKQQTVKDSWAAKNGPESWVFDEASCAYIPPVPYPTDGKIYEWDEPTTSWIEVIE